MRKKTKRALRRILLIALISLGVFFIGRISAETPLDELGPSFIENITSFSQQMLEANGIQLAKPSATPVILDDPIQLYDVSVPPNNHVDAYIVVNDNRPYFADEEKQRTDAFELYSDLDQLGRCGPAFANLCTELMPTNERESIGSIKPSGWHTVTYPDLIEDRYLYNRCHLIGFQLAGENANEKNLITGTRYFNVTGMLPFENAVASYLRRNPDAHVLYRVTPSFDESNLVADGVLMEAWSVEDGGVMSFCVFVYNVQPGIAINYATGESARVD